MHFVMKLRQWMWVMALVPFLFHFPKLSISARPQLSLLSPGFCFECWCFLNRCSFCTNSSLWKTLNEGVARGVLMHEEYVTGWLKGDWEKASNWANVGAQGKKTNIYGCERANFPFLNWTGFIFKCVLNGVGRIKVLQCPHCKNTVTRLKIK